MSDFLVWTDGGCNPNPGTGGYGIIIKDNTIQDEKEKERERQQGFIKSTNNRMELLAVIEALKEIPKEASVKLYTDSKYVVNHVNKNEKRNNNHDLWKLFDEVMENRNSVEIVWVKGYKKAEITDEIRMNNKRCDEMVHKARKGELILDKGYNPQS